MDDVGAGRAAEAVDGNEGSGVRMIRAGLDPRLRQRPFLFWLLAVQMLAVAPLLVFAGWAVYKLGEGNQQAAVSDLRRRVAIAADTIAHEADRVKTRLQLLAVQDAARAGDVPGVRRSAVALMAVDPAVAGVSALDRDGQVVFTTQVPEGQALPRLPMPPGAASVFATGEVQVGGLATGGTNDIELVGVAVPWRVEGRTRYALHMTIRPRDLGDLLRAQRWPPSWTAALVDQNHVIVARSRDEGRFVGKPVTDSLRQLIEQGALDVSYSTTKDGTEVVTAVAPVKGTPWWVVAGLPREALAAEIERPFRLLVPVGALLTLLGIVASVAVSRFLNRQVQEAASGTGRGGVAVREFDAIGAQRLILQNDLVGMVRLVNRRSVWHNPAMEKLFGYGPGELAGHSPRLMHLDDASFESFGRAAYATLSAGGRVREQLPMRRKDGSRIWVDVSGVALPDGSTLWMLVDVTAMRAERDRVEGIAFHDQLTGLPNRALLEDRLQQGIAASQRTGQDLALCFIDLNGFKEVNDRLGHAAGDRLLRDIARRLEGCVRSSDTVARLGGDEFVLLLTQGSEVDRVVARAREVVGRPSGSGPGACRVTAAIGVARYPRDAAGARELLELADSRMYADKAAIKSGG